MTELSEVDLKIIAGIRNAVQARGRDWRYPEHTGEESDWRAHDGRCRNLLPNGDPACIIGFIAVDQGLETRQESTADEDGAHWGVSNPVRIAMRIAQNTQDAGLPWGEAHDGFFEYLADQGLTLPE